MSIMKLSVTRTKTGPKVQYEPVQVSIELTPEQRDMISRFTGQSPSKLELTASDLKLILRPHNSEIEQGW